MARQARELSESGVYHVMIRGINYQYKRVGHLYQDRFRSEPIGDDAYLLMALRYIHRNPVKAGLCAKPEDYPGSSYRAYLNGHDALTDTGFVLSIMPRDQLKAFTEQENEDRFIEIEEPGFPKTDEEAKAAMLALSGCASASEIQRLAKNEREAIFRMLYQEGVNIAQIGRITGYNRKVVYRALGG